MNHWDNIGNALSPLQESLANIDKLFMNDSWSKINDALRPLISWQDNLTKSLQPLKDIGSQLNSYAQIQMNSLNPTINTLQMFANDSLSSINSFINSLDWQNTILNMNQTLHNIFDPLNINGIFDGSILEQEIDVLDEKAQKQFVADSITAVEVLTQKKELTDNEKKTWLRKFWKILFKVLSGVSVSIIIPLMFFICGPYFNKYFEENINPKIYYNQFLEIQQKNPTLDLRMITRDTFIFKGKKMKKQMAIISKNEIVQVIETYKDRIKIRVYNTDEIGWIYKKYTTK